MRTSTGCNPIRPAIGLAVCLLALVGCSRGPEMASAGGSVIVAGKPYPGGKIVFAPVAKDESGKAGRAAVSLLDNEGRFALTTYQAGDGAIVGEHVVTLFRAEDDRKSRPDLAKLDFSRVSLPTGRVTVVAGQENSFEISLSLEDLKRYGNRL